MEDMKDKAVQLAERIEDNISRVMIGKKQAIRYMLIVLTAGGHLLLEDVPGIG